MIISILGCGWLGLPLSEHLIRLNHTIKGSTTTKDKIEQLRARSIEPYIIELTPALPNAKSVVDFWQSDVLVLNIPPGRKRDNIIDFHTEQVQSVIAQVKNSPIKFIVFISSTSVYPENPGVVHEQDTIPGEATRDSGNALLQAEEMLMSTAGFDTTIVRFGGLYGGDRHPAKYMAGRKNLTNGNAPVNLIHRDDCIAIITQVIEENIKGEIFNAVADKHPTRQEYYVRVAEALGIEPPAFKVEDEPKKHKIVSNEKIKQHLSYSFIHPEPTMP